MGSRAVPHTRSLQTDSLDRDAPGVPARSVKNSFAPINRIPPEVLSLIPDYHGWPDADRGLITLTHVCRWWRETFISRSSLWTQLDLMNPDKTRTYIQRSQSSPLELYLGDHKVVDHAFALVIPHIRRIKSLIINVYSLPGLLRHFRGHLPLLETLDINFARDLALDDALFGGDLSSLRELRLRGAITQFPWKNMGNLRVANLRFCSPRYTVTQLLDFFESAPFLHTVELEGLTRGSSDAPPERVVPLCHLKALTINAVPPHSILLRHLRIPIGASLVSWFCFDGDGSPLLDYLPERSPNLDNLSNITTINLSFDPQLKSVRLSGPSGSLCVVAVWGYWGDSPSYTKDRQLLRSLGDRMPSTIQRLAISKYKHPRPAEVEECPVFQTLSSMSNLRTLTLIDCNNLPFIRTLDPEQHPSNLVLCSGMEELVFYITSWYKFRVKHLISMARNRASRGAKLSSITLVDLGGRGQRKEVVKLREHATRVEYRVDGVSPAWDEVLV